MTDYTDPSTIDVDTVISEINHAFLMRGSSWTDVLSWPNVTVKALADEIERLRFFQGHLFHLQLEEFAPRGDDRWIRGICTCGWRAGDDNRFTLEINAWAHWHDHLRSMALEEGYDV